MALSAPGPAKVRKCREQGASPGLRSSCHTGLAVPGYGVTDGLSLLAQRGGGDRCHVGVRVSGWTVAQLLALHWGTSGTGAHLVLLRAGFAVSGAQGPSGHCSGHIWCWGHIWEELRAGFAGSGGR